MQNLVTITVAFSLLNANGVEQTSRLTERQRIEAITVAYGLGCAVQDHDIDRAAAWASVAMATTAALASEGSPEAAQAYAEWFYSAEQDAKAKGGFNCDGVPKWPTK